MVGRNDPCPCGSGKKYKKCCAGKNEVSVQELVEEELDQIIGNYFNQDLSHADVAEFERYESEWRRLLRKNWDQDKLLELVSEYFIFVARRDLWKRYLIKLLNSPIRSSVRSILALWQDPIVLVGKVIEHAGNSIVVEEILGSECYQLEITADMPTVKGSVILGVVLRDNRKWANGVFVITGLVSIDDTDDVFKKDFIALAESSGIENRNGFYKKHLIDVYNLLNKKRIRSETDEEISDELTVLQQQAVSILEEYIETEDVLPEVQALLTNLLTMYLLIEQPGFRKPEILAAATVLVAMEFGAFEGLYYTQAEISKVFDVSVASMKKHADRLSEFMIELAPAMEAENEEATRLHYAVGTDPLLTESVNWQMYCKMSQIDFDTLEETQAFMTQTMNDTLQPKDHKQEAQMLAYAAYEAKSDKERFALAEKVLKQDPANVDGLLLKAERTKVNQEKFKLYQSAIKIGEALFDDEDIDNPWRFVPNRPYMRAIFVYGVALYEAGKYKEAAHTFDKLLAINPADNQGARYLAISSFIHAGNYNQAMRILDDYDEDSEHDATHLYLDWYLERARYGEEDLVDAMLLLSAAIDVNPYVKGLLDTNSPVIPYPKSMHIAAGSIEEAQFIRKLLQ